MEIFNLQLENEIIAIAINNDEAKDMFNAIIVNPNTFYYGIHAFISNELRSSNTSLKIQLLKKIKSCGKFTQNEITCFRWDYSNIRGYKEKCYLLLELYAKRVAYECSEMIIQGLSNEKDIFQLRNDISIKLESIDNLVPSSDIKLLSDVITEVQEEAKLKHNSDNKNTGIRCYFKEIDRITGGWQNSDLIIIAARPSMGKTALVLSMARNISVIDNTPVALFSLEMSATQLVKRLISGEAEVNAMVINNGMASNSIYEQWNSKADSLKSAPIYIDDTAGLKLIELRSKCRNLVLKMGVKIIIIDYLQLMSGNGKGNREQEISSISRGLKIIAKDLNVPVIALSQLSRSVESRGGDKRPVLSDLRESGAIEQDADIVSFVYRAEYYGITQDEEGNSTDGIAELIIAKHRNGALGNPQLKFNKKIAKFQDIDTYQNDFNADIHIEPNVDFDAEKPF